jgi:nucleoside phosphorylase
MGFGPGEERETGPVAVGAATEGELKGFTENLNLTCEKWNHTRTWTGMADGRELIVFTGGVGKTLTAAAVSRLIQLYSPSSVIFTGIVAGIRP